MFLSPKRIVLIYQMGRVASVAIEQALNQHLKSNIGVIHTHGLSETLQGYYKEMKTSLSCSQNMKNDAKNYFLFIHRVKKYILINKIINNEIFIYSGVRNSISHSLSCFFHNLYHFFPSYDCLKNDNERAFESLKNIYFGMLNLRIKNDLISQSYHARYFSYYMCLAKDFFDIEFNGVLKTNIYKYTFDKNKNYLEFKHNNNNFFIYKYEFFNNLQKELDCFIPENLKKNKITFNKVNSNNDKEISNIYNFFIKNIKYNDEQLNFLLDNKYMKHFYSDLEINNLYKKWSN